jgi:putative endonuclease
MPRDFDGVLTHFAYIVRCGDGTLYTGYARDPVKRAAVHNAGKGARYTAGRRPVSLVYWEAFDSAGDALRRERQLKRLRRAMKESLIAARPGASGQMPIASGAFRV